MKSNSSGGAFKLAQTHAFEMIFCQKMMRKLSIHVVCEHFEEFFGKKWLKNVCFHQEAELLP